MNDKSFVAIEQILDQLKLKVETDNQDRCQYLQMRLDELKALSKYTNHDTSVFAQRVADIGRGIIPIPLITSHEYPNYPVFRTYKDGSFEGGDYETWQLWTMKQLDPQIMSKPKPIKLHKVFIVFGGGFSGLILTGYLVSQLALVIVINPVRGFVNWFIEDQTIENPWVDENGNKRKSISERAD